MAQQISVRVVSKSILLAALLAFMQVACAAEKVKIAGTYSSLNYHQEAGDLLGYEFRLIPTKQGFKAVIQVSEGGIGNVFLVDVDEKSGSISFDVPVSSDYVGRFRGELTRDGLDGVVNYPSGVSEKVLLKRSVSYWERQ